MSNGRTSRSRWSAEFIGMLEALRMGPQFQAGRRYARTGLVRQLTISSSLVVALVRDPDGEQTHRARIAVRAFSAAEWTRVERDLAREAFYAAKLLAGELPDDVDRVFAKYGLALFPDGVGDLAMDCTCPDWQVPCRHLTAACYVLAESFDTDPFGILAWRGRTREEFLQRLRALRAATGAAPVAERSADPPLSECLDSFWTGDSGRSRPVLPDPPVARGVRRPDALLEQLDPLRLTVGRHEVIDLLRPAYEAITRSSAPPRG